MADQQKDLTAIGWFGTAAEVLGYLSVIGADRDVDGRYVIAGEPVTAGLGGDEVVVPAGTVYFVDAKPIPLAVNMPASRGLQIKVF